MAPKDVSGWSVADVTAWLEGLQLDAVVPLVKENAVNGQDLLSLSEEELTGDLGCTPLQARKIRRNLEELTGEPAAKAAPAAAASAPAPPPAAPMPAPGAAPFLAPAPAVTIAAADLARIKQLDEQIAGLEKLETCSMEAQAQRSVQHLSAQVAASRKALPKLQQALAEEAEKMKKVEEDWYPGKHLMGKKHHEEKKEEQGVEVAKADEALRAEERRLAEAEGKLGEAHKVLAAWQAKARDLSGARRERQALFDRIFSAPEWTRREPLESLAAAERDLREQATQIRQEANVYLRARDLVKAASGKLQGALQALRGTQMMGMMDMATGMSPFVPRRHVGSGMMNMMEMAAVQQADGLVQSAAQDMASARSVLPAVPPVEEALMKAAMAGVFQNFLFPGLGGDMMQIAMVRKSMESVERMAAQVQQSLGWVEGEVSGIQGRAAQLAGAAEAKKAEAEAFKQGQLRRALAGEAYGPAPALGGTGGAGGPGGPSII